MLLIAGRYFLSVALGAVALGAIVGAFTWTAELPARR